MLCDYIKQNQYIYMMPMLTTTVSNFRKELLNCETDNDLFYDVTRLTRDFSPVK